MSKFEEIANKAKEKVNEAVDVAKNYDYKAKAEELKEKASDIADKAKEYDYKEKAKEITDSVKNYDYKNEAENIKKGGIKYFWNKHKKFSIIAIILLVVGFVVFSNSNNTDNTDGKFIKNDDMAIEIATDRTYKGVGGKNPQFISADIIERNKNNEYLIEVIWKEDTSNRYTTNFVVYIALNKKLSDNSWDYNWNYDFTQSENYLEDLVPKFKSDIGWVD